MHRARFVTGGLILIAAALTTFPVQAQYGVPWYNPYGSGYGYGFGGGTAAGNYLQGMSTVIRSAGEYNLLSSQAGVNNEEARSRYLDNQKKWSQNYFQMKEQRLALDAQQREATRHANETLIASAKAGGPRPLGPDSLDPVTGRITWPDVLQGAEFKKQRDEVDQLFELRAKTSRAEATGLKIHAALEDMSKLLRGQVQKLPANDYMAARKFLDALDRAARTNS